MYDYSWNPYTIDPGMYVQQALAPMQGGMPQMPQMQGEQKSFGPTHGALSNYFQQALQNQLGVPGLLHQMQQNPALAQQIGGLLGQNYTPPAMNPYHIDWAAAEAVAKANAETPAPAASSGD
jgi:hypothetical protein